MFQEIKSEVEKILNLGVKWLKDDGRAPSMTFFYTNRCNFYIDPLDFSNKPKTMHNLRLIARKSKANMVIILCNIFIGNLYGPPPSQAPDRREAIFAYGEDRNDNYGIAQEYKRDSMNKIKLGKKTVFEKGQMKGPMTGIL